MTTQLTNSNTSSWWNCFTLSRANPLIHSALTAMGYEAQQTLDKTAQFFADTPLEAMPNFVERVYTELQFNKTPSTEQRKKAELYVMTFLNDQRRILGLSKGSQETLKRLHQQLLRADFGLDHFGLVQQACHILKQQINPPVIVIKPEQISDQIKLLKANSIKSILGSVMLYQICKIPDDPTADLVSPLIQEASYLTDLDKSNDYFMTLVKREIDNSKLNFLLKPLAKLCCSLLYLVLTPYMNTLFDKVEKDILDFIALPHEKQIANLTQFFINPLTEYLEKVRRGYDDLAKTDPRDLLARTLNIPQNTPQAPQMPWNDLVSAVVDRYVNEKKGIRRFVDAIIRSPLKAMIATNILPYQYEETKKTMGIVGSQTPLHSVKLSLLNLIEGLQKSMIEKGDVAPSSTVVPPALEKPMGELVGRLFEVLRIQMKSPTVADLQNGFQEGYLDSLINSQAQPSITWILSQMFASKNAINGLLLSSLVNTNESCFKPLLQPLPTEAQKKQDEAKLIEKVGQILPLVIEDTIEQSPYTPYFFGGKGNRSGATRSLCEQTTNRIVTPYVTPFIEHLFGFFGHKTHFDGLVGHFLTRYSV